MDTAYAEELVPLYMEDRDSQGKVCWVCLGWHPQELLRGLISRKEARFDKKGTERRVLLNASAPASLRVRALSSGSATRALSTTYTEMLYPDSPEQLKHKRDNGIDVTVTATRITMKKYRRGIGFIPWTDLDAFPRRRFNPDRIRQPVYPTIRAAERALAAARVEAQ